MKLKREMYFAILLDRSTAGPIMIGCSEGGTSIEDLAEKYPEKIIKIPVDIRTGITDAQATDMAKGLGVTADLPHAAAQIKGLYDLFVKSDCTMVEVSACGSAQAVRGLVCGSAARWERRSPRAPEHSVNGPACAQSASTRLLVAPAHLRHLLTTQAHLSTHVHTPRLKRP